MKIGNQIVNGTFEFNEQLEFTESDLVIRTYYNSEDERIRQIYYVKTNVIGVLPENDVNETYYEDYFKRIYKNEKPGILTKANVYDFMRGIFAGINEEGVFEPEEISISAIDSINISGLWKIMATREMVLVLISNPKSFMLIYNHEFIKLRLGDYNADTHQVSWGGYKLISGNMDDVMVHTVTALHTLEKQLRDKVTQYDDLIEALKED